MLKNRPAAFLCLVFSAGIAAGLFLSFEKTAGMIIAAVTTVVLLLIIKKKTWAKAFLITTAALVLGFSYAKIYVLCFSPAVPDEKRQYTFVAAVREVDEKSSYTNVEAKVQDKTSPFDGKRICMYIYGSSPRAGDVISVSGKVNVANEKNKAKGVDYVVYGDYAILSAVEPEGFYFKVLSIRNWVGGVIDSTYGGEAAGFYKALLIGDRSDLTMDFEGAFSRSGLSHIMAISGQHFSLIVFNAYLLLLAVFRRKKFCSVVAILLAIAYTVFTGASPSIIRACFMCSAVFAASLFNQESDGIINLSVALIVLLLVNPYSIINTSLQLSFLATAGILYTLYHLELYFERRKTSKWVIALTIPLAMSASASLFCTPVFLTTFDYVSVLAPLSNILVNWLVEMAVICGILFIVPALLMKEIGIVPTFIFRAVKSVAVWVSSLKIACASVDMPYIKLLFIPSVFTISAFSYFKPKKAVAIISGVFIATLAVVVGCSALQDSRRESNAVFYVSDGLSTAHAFYADGRLTAIIDCNGATGVSGTVTQNGYTYIDAYVVTVCTEDTVTRLRRTLPYTPVDTVYIPWEENDYTEEAVSFAKRKGCKVIRYKDQALTLGYMTVYTPDSNTLTGGYVVKAKKSRSSLSIISTTSWISCDAIDRNDTLVITKTAINEHLDYNLLPYTYEKLIVSYDEVFCRFAEDIQMAKSIDTYDGSLLLYFGKDGIVKEQ